jgi:hypothetical protein
MNAGKTRACAATLAAAVLLAGCGQGQFWGPPAPPPPRPGVPAGPGWTAETAYLSAHPLTVPKGMQAGILVRSSSPGYVCAGWCRTWQGTVVIPGGQAEELSSDQGDDGMASLASPGDLIEFPAANLPVDAPGEDGSDAPAVLLRRAVVSIP